MTLDELLINLQAARAELPGDTEVICETYTWNDISLWYDIVEHAIDSVGFFPTPASDEEKVVRLR